MSVIRSSMTSIPEENWNRIDWSNGGHQPDGRNKLGNPPTESGVPDGVMVSPATQKILFDLVENYPSPKSANEKTI